MILEPAAFLFCLPMTPSLGQCSPPHNEGDGGGVHTGCHLRSRPSPVSLPRRCRQATPCLELEGYPLSRAQGPGGGCPSRHFTAFGGALSSYTLYWRLSNHPPGAVHSLPTWEQCICTTNSFAWPSGPSTTGRQPSLSTLKSLLFSSTDLTSNKAETLIFPPHTVQPLIRVSVFAFA